MAKILLVEDDLDLAGRINEFLTFENHTVEAVSDGDEAADRLKIYQYELVILDWGLPGLTGLEVCQRFRAAGGVTPVLMLTGKNEIDEKTAGLDAGADDYLTKPFHLRELSARIRALLRRPEKFKATVLEVGKLKLDPSLRKVYRDGKELVLLPREYALLEFLMRHPEEIFSPETLLNRVWSSESESSVNTVYTYIKTLRRKISDQDGNSAIKNIHGVGYKLEST
jgi:DNA-binding response OmpR family regulator